MKIPIEKNKEYIVDIIDNGFEGEGIAKIDNFTIFIPNAIKGESVKILIIKVQSSYAFGKIIKIIKRSNIRIEEDCISYKRCGGCSLRHIEYEETLNIKKQTIQSLINKMLKQKIKVYQTWAMGRPYHYRNKLQYPIGQDKNGKTLIGTFANRSHQIVPVEGCLIQNKQANEIQKYFIKIIEKYKLSIYNEQIHKGIIRHLVIKTGTYTNQIMVIIVINSKTLPHIKEIANELQNKWRNIVSVILNVNMDNTNVILGNKNINIIGNGYIEDKLGDFYFRISPLSFYQVNPLQAELLYNIAIENAKISKSDIVFDLYCGIGTISLFAAQYANKVYGIEIVEQAIEDAKFNAQRNNIKNAEFIAGDTELIFNDLINKKNVIPNIVIVDPPRKGLDNTTINNLTKIRPKRIAYISCNPSTLVRDLAKLEDIYDIKMIQPVDMFPWTKHVECITLLSLKN